MYGELDAFLGVFVLFERGVFVVSYVVFDLVVLYV